MKKISRAKSKCIHLSQCSGTTKKQSQSLLFKDTCILLKIASRLSLLYQNSLIVIFLLSFQLFTLKRKSYWLWGKILPKMDRPSSSVPDTQKFETGAHLCSILLNPSALLLQPTAAAILCYGHHSFSNLPSHAENHCSPGILQAFSSETAEAATPVDLVWGLSRIETAIAECSAHTVYAILIHLL